MGVVLPFYRMRPLGSLLRDMVVRGAGLGVPGHTTPGDVIQTPEFSSAVGPRIAILLLSGPLGSRSLPINWGRWRMMRSSCVCRL
jgi:hypothetical protein